MKKLTGERYGVVKHTDNIYISDENQLWGKGVISTETTKGLSHGFIYNCKVFWVRGMSE